MGGAVVEGGDDVFGGTAQLKQAVLEVGEFGGGQDDGVIGQAAALGGGAALVGALAARLGAVAAASACLGVVGQLPAAPAAVAGRGHGGIMPAGSRHGGVGSSGRWSGCWVIGAHSCGAY